MFQDNASNWSASDESTKCMQERTQRDQLFICVSLTVRRLVWCACLVSAIAAILRIISKQEAVVVCPAGPAVAGRPKTPSAAERGSHCDNRTRWSSRACYQCSLRRRRRQSGANRSKHERTERNNLSRVCQRRASIPKCFAKIQGGPKTERRLNNVNKSH